MTPRLVKLHKQKKGLQVQGNMETEEAPGKY
jgi:hypothetical protein